MVDVTQNLRLRTVALGPTPLLLQFVGEGIRILHAFDIAATPGIAVPVPGPADPAGGLESAHLETELAQTIDRVQPADSRTDNDRIEPRRPGVGCRHLGSSGWGAYSPFLHALAPASALPQHTPSQYKKSTAENFSDKT